MKIVVKENKKKKGNYIFPFLAKNEERDIIIMFTGACTGIVLVSNDSDYMEGEYSDCWEMNEFQYFHGTIEISS